METLLIDKGFYKKHGENLINFLISQGIEIRANKKLFNNKLIVDIVERIMALNFLITFSQLKLWKI